MFSLTNQPVVVSKLVPEQQARVHSYQALQAAELVLSGDYWKSDRARNEMVVPAHLFNLASSVSKPQHIGEVIRCFNAVEDFFREHAYPYIKNLEESYGVKEKISSKEVLQFIHELTEENVVAGGRKDLLSPPPALRPALEKLGLDLARELSGVLQSGVSSRIPTTIAAVLFLIDGMRQIQFPSMDSNPVSAGIGPVASMLLSTSIAAAVYRHFSPEEKNGFQQYLRAVEPRSVNLDADNLRRGDSPTLRFFCQNFERIKLIGSVAVGAGRFFAPVATSIEEPFLAGVSEWSKTPPLFTDGIAGTAVISGSEGALYLSNRFYGDRVLFQLAPQGLREEVFSSLEAIPRVFPLTRASVALNDDGTVRELLGDRLGVQQTPMTEDIERLLGGGNAHIAKLWNDYDLLFGANPTNVVLKVCLDGEWYVATNNVEGGRLYFGEPHTGTKFARAEFLLGLGEKIPGSKHSVGGLHWFRLKDPLPGAGVEESPGPAASPPTFSSLSARTSDRQPRIERDPLSDLRRAISRKGPVTYDELLSVLKKNFGVTETDQGKGSHRSLLHVDQDGHEHTYTVSKRWRGDTPWLIPFLKKAVEELRVDLDSFVDALRSYRRLT